MGDVQKITGPRRAESLARELNSGHRTRPAVVVSTPSGALDPWIDADRVVSELGDLADVFVLATLESSWAFSAAMPSRTQVYGGAGRVYPVSLDWVHDPLRSRLRVAYTAGEGEGATARLIEDGLAEALRAGSLAPAQGAATVVEVVGVIRGCPTSSQALVAVAGGYATIQVGMLLSGVPADRMFTAGMQVSGALDQQARRLDVRALLPDPATRLGQISDGQVLWARVEAVKPAVCELAPYPGAAVQVPWQRVTDNAEDDLTDLMSIGEIVAVRATRSPQDDLLLTLIGIEDLAGPCSALSIFPGGPPWLLPPPDPGKPPAAAPTEPARSEPVPPAVLSTSLPVPSQAKPSPTTRAPEPAAAPPRWPTPLLIGPRRPEQDPAPPTNPRNAPALPAGREALRGMSLQLEAARTRNQLLEAAVKTAEANLRSAQVEILLLEKDLTEKARALSSSETTLRRLRARIRSNVQEERRTAGRREAAPGEDLFLDLADQFRFLVTDRWARRILATEKAEKPLKPYRFGPRFVDSLREIEGVDRSKVADVVVDVLTGLAENSAGRDMHPLRSGMGGDDPVLQREGYTCWRVAIQRRTPQARRLHFWRSGEDIELSRVVLHDDYAP